MLQNPKEINRSIDGRVVHVKTYTFLLVGLIVLFVTVAAYSSEPQWLRYYSAREIRQVLGNVGSQSIDLTTDRPADLRLPDSPMIAPLYGAWLTPMVKGGRVWLVLDRSKGRRYDRLWIDSNANHSLADEKAVEAYQAETHRSCFGPAQVLFELDEALVAYHLNLEFTRYRTNRLSASAGAWYEGSVAINGQKKRCLLVDRNANGTFNDTSDRPSECDGIWIGDKDALEMSLVGREVAVGTVVYSPQVARDGACISFNPADEIVYGSIVLPETINELQVEGNNLSFIIHPEKGRARLPVGQYLIKLWRSQRTDKEGHTWALTGQEFNGSGQFDVKTDESLHLQIGEPVTCIVQVRKKDSRFSFNQRLEGRFNERIALTRNGSKAPPPKLHIKNADGTYHRTYSFEYG